MGGSVAVARPYPHRDMSEIGSPSNPSNRFAASCSDIKASCVWLEVARCQTPSMITTRTSHVPFTELPSEARVLLFMFAMGAAARHVAQPPKRAELDPLLEIIWNRNRLCLSDFADPRRMTALLKTELSSLCIAGGAQ
jgi:hypothetical protein